jgi:hypothetical protein
MLKNSVNIYQNSILLKKILLSYMIRLAGVKPVKHDYILQTGSILAYRAIYLALR